jgi:ADP-heptose:LPS heptosyltransferase
VTIRTVRGALTVVEADDRPLWGGGRDGVAFRRPELSSGSRRGWDTFGRILCVRLDAMGDVLMTTPALRALKSARPDRHLALLASPAGAEIAALLPEVDEVIVYEAPWIKASDARPPDDPRPDLALVRRLADAAFDAAIVFTVHSQSPLPAALLCHLAGIPRRLAHSRDKPYGLLTEWVTEPEPQMPLRHEARRQLDLLSAVGIDGRDERLSVRVPASASRRVRGLLESAEIDARLPWLLVHPGATAPSRRYPEERWADAVRLVERETGWPIVWSGSTNERSFVDAIKSHAGVGVSFAGDLSVGDLAALVALAPLLLTNNTGPAHLAAAVGTPVVDVYAQTNAQHGPWRVPNRVVFADVPCRGCERSICPMGHHRCLRDVPANAVAAATIDLATEVGLLAPARAPVLAAAAGSGVPFTELT